VFHFGRVAKLARSRDYRPKQPQGLAATKSGIECSRMLVGVTPAWARRYPEKIRCYPVENSGLRLWISRRYPSDFAVKSFRFREPNQKYDCFSTAASKSHSRKPQKRLPESRVPAIGAVSGIDSQELGFLRWKILQAISSPIDS